MIIGAFGVPRLPDGGHSQKDSKCLVSWKPTSARSQVNNIVDILSPCARDANVFQPSQWPRIPRYTDINHSENCPGGLLG